MAATRASDEEEAEGGTDGGAAEGANVANITGSACDGNVVSDALWAKPLLSTPPPPPPCCSCRRLGGI